MNQVQSFNLNQHRDLFPGAIPIEGTVETAEEAIVQTKLDWEVDLKPISVNGEVKDKFLAITRDTDNKTFGVVKPGWKPLQNREAFSFFDPLVQSGLATYHAAGTTNDGERVWVLAKVIGDQDEIVEHDKVARFILLSNGHTGHYGIKVALYLFREWCSNGAYTANGLSDARFIHSLQTHRSLAELQGLLVNAKELFDETIGQYKQLAGVKTQNVEQYVTNVLYPSKKIEVDASSEELSRTTKRIVDLYYTHPTNNARGVKGTLWSAFNAVTYYVDHERSRTETSRVNSALFGEGKEIKRRALLEAVKLAA